MNLSIIIPCRNEELYIKQCIQSVLDNDYPVDDYEIIMVDGQSEDQTIEIINAFIQKHPNISLIHNPKRIAPIAMNLGIKKAKGNIIMRMDAHTFYPKNYISKLLYWKDKLSADNVGAVWVTDVLNQNPKSIAIKKVLSNKFGVGNAFFRTGISEAQEVDTVPFGCYDKALLIEVGGYNELLVRNQDIELNKRLKSLGKKIILVPDVKCIYYARDNYWDLAKNNYANGKWNILTVYITKNFSALSIRHFIPLCFVLAVLLPLILSLLKFQFMYLTGLVLLMYISAISWVISKMDKGATNSLTLLKTFLVLHFSYGFGSLVGIFNLSKLFKK